MNQAKVMNRDQRRAAQRYLQQQSEQWPQNMVIVPREQWPITSLTVRQMPLQVFRSKDYLACVYDDPNGHFRVSVQRTAITRSGDWVEGITWDELQRIKREIGFGELWAVEVFPPDEHLVNVANIRHLWLLSEAPRFAWISKGTASR